MRYSIPEGREILELRESSIKTGTCLHLFQGLAQKRNFNPKSKQEKYRRKFKSRVDHEKIHAKWLRAPPLSQLENLATLWDTVCMIVRNCLLRNRGEKHTKNLPPEREEKRNNTRPY